MPAYTFIATASAAEQCGYEVLLADVDERDGSLDPARVLEHPQRDRIGVVVPVAPFGRPLAQAPWLAFRERTGIPVVIDGAACFEALGRDPRATLGPIPVALSFHATKSFAVGEGGCVLGRDLDLLQRTMRALNFGFAGDRNSHGPSINGKMSEYHAAVGLAELDGWPAKSRAFAEVAGRYRSRLADTGLLDRWHGAPEIASCYALFRCRDSEESTRVQAALQAAGIGFRLWYGTGLQDQAWVARTPHGELPVTRRLARLLIGLPSAADLGDVAIARVVDALAHGVHGA
jgi:dTDP-4-amino-4,6-dideoxygalactose transaminase